VNYKETELLEQLQEVDAHEFEQFVADLWELQNWRTQVTKAADDGGIDIIAEQPTPVPQKQVIQVKRYSPSNSVGRPEIQQYASIREEQIDVDTVVIVTTSRFTDNAKEVSKSLNVKLIDGSRLYNLIDALDAFQLAHSYIDPDSGRTGRHQIDGKTNTSNSTPERQDSGERSKPIAEFDQDTQPKDVPTILPEVIKLHQKITTHFQDIRSMLDSAETAFDQQRYFDAVGGYGDVNSKRIALERKIAQYDASLTHIDNRTANHLPSTERYADQLSRLMEGVNERSQEAFRIAERAKGLELLGKEITDQVGTIEDHIERGDGLRQNGEIEAAQSQYERAKEGLKPVRETMEMYQGLITESDEAVIQTHDGIPQEISLPALESEISSRIESEEEYVDRVDIAENAAGSFDARVLTENNGGLFEKDLIEYLEKGEQPEYIFKPPRMGFRVVSSGMGDGAPQHDATASGSCFLMITDQRVLYVAGVDDHDETQRFEFEQLSDVEVSTDAASPSLAFDVSGNTYRFEGLRDNISDLAAASEFLTSHS
jgi:hypothetical protein